MGWSPVRNHCPTNRITPAVSNTFSAKVANPRTGINQARPGSKLAPEVSNQVNAKVAGNAATNMTVPESVGANEYAQRHRLARGAFRVGQVLISELVATMPWA